MGIGEAAANKFKGRYRESNDGQSVLLTKTSMFTGQEHTMSIPMSGIEFDGCLRRWMVEGFMIQDAFRSLDADQREFIMTGVTPQEWDDAFKEEGETHV